MKSLYIIQILFKSNKNTHIYIYSLNTSYKHVFCWLCFKMLNIIVINVLYIKRWNTYPIHYTHYVYVLYVLLI